MFWSIDSGEYNTFWLCLHSGHPDGHKENHHQVLEQEVFMIFFYYIYRRKISALTVGPKCKFLICIITKYDGLMVM